jgi:alpha-L-rhamnosidase
MKNFIKSNTCVGLRILIVLCLSVLLTEVKGASPEKSQPTALSVNLLTHADQVFLNGYPVNTPLYQAIDKNENYQFTEIAQKRPFFGWVVNSVQNNVIQTAYRIMVAKSFGNIQKEIDLTWDSGKIESDQSVNISYSGSDLEPNAVYFWKVKTWNNHGEESPFSAISQFKTAPQLADYSTARYPLQKQDVNPVIIKSVSNTVSFIDFGKAAFGRLGLTLFGNDKSDSVTIRLGEAKKDGRINRSPGGTIRYSEYSLALRGGWNTYIIAIAPDKMNTGPRAIPMPAYIGEVTPFRYVEIEGYEGTVDKYQVVQEVVSYPFNENDSWFTSSDTVLNKVWDLCKYSMKATSFTGIYIDGDRERIPYEADAYINQLGHYCVAREYSMARYTHEYLINHPTWPTEWILQSVLMAWNDYMYTGNKESLRCFYNDLKAKTLIALEDEAGFISTTTGRVTPEVLQSIHFDGKLRDIVDWPQPGAVGVDKNAVGEVDGFVLKDVNTAVNAFHYRALNLASGIAGLLGEQADKKMFLDKAQILKSSFNTKLIDKKTGIYIDGIGTDHKSLHASMFPLALGLVPDKNTAKILEFIRSRGMACGVYGAQFLMDGVYDSNDADYGLKLLTLTTDRSWYNMIRSGSTISMEAWDNKYKPNLDWNHAWGAVPANIIPRKLMGIEPLEPGFRKIQIKPQPSTLKNAEIKCPTIRGEVMVAFTNEPGKSFKLKISVPANTTADVYLPFWSKTQKVTQNGKTISFRQNGSFAVIEGVGSGNNSFEVSNVKGQ